jgi:amino-acid N-acetyltransferase
VLRIERANGTDVTGVESLLAAAGLPLDGAAEALALGIVARDGDALVGAAAVERYAAAGLLRSVVVRKDMRGAGVGRAVVEAAEDLARREGVQDLYLLTETAVDWFQRFGYSVVDRAVAALAVGRSVEFATVCGERGVAMRKGLWIHG